jgi:hypothetical protein
MRSVLGVLALQLGLAGAVWGQEAPVQAAPASEVWFPRVSVTASVGVFAPVLPVIAIKNGTDASIALESSPAVGIEFGYHFSPSLGIYAGLTHARSFINHSTAMVLTDPPRAESPVGVYVPTGGFVWSPTVGNWLVRPMIRLGAGAKFYNFALVEVKHPVHAVSGDLGLGLMGSSGSVTLVAEARWMPSQFDPVYLPVRVAESKKQLQNDWVFQLGAKLGF